jgi:general secretion pathway protein N
MLLVFSVWFIRLSSVQRDGRSSPRIVHPWIGPLKSLRKYLIGSVVLLVTAAVLLWFLPARWVLRWIEPQLHGIQLQQVSGSVWNGRAGAVMAANGKTLGQLQWQMSPEVLLGQPRMRVHFDGPQVTFSADAKQLPADEVIVQDASVRVTSAALDHALATPWGQPRGELRVLMPRALLRAGWPIHMDAQATWRDAVMRTPQGDVALGELHAIVQARGGVIDAQLHDSGSGPLQLTGELQLSPIGWRLDARLRARQTDPTLRRWLATLGAPAADGSVHIQRHGGLAGTTPASSTN